MSISSGEIGTFYFLVVCHLLGDFLLQPRFIIERKKIFNKYMLIHGATMALAFFLPLFNFPAGRTIGATLIVFLSHVTIDSLRVEINRILKLVPGTYGGALSLGLDQILHISIIYLLFRFTIQV